MKRTKVTKNDDLDDGFDKILNEKMTLRQFVAEKIKIASKFEDFMQKNGHPLFSVSTYQFWQDNYDDFFFTDGEDE